MHGVTLSIVSRIVALLAACGYGTRESLDAGTSFVAIGCSRVSSANWGETTISVVYPCSISFLVALRAEFPTVNVDAFVLHRVRTVGELATFIDHGVEPGIWP